MLSFFPVIPDVVSSQTVYIVNETDTVTFQCTTAGIPSPTLSWFNGSAALNDSDSRVTIGDAGSQLLTSLLYQVTQNVTILNANSDDNGSYSCLAGNSAGTDEAIFELVVRSEYLEGVVYCTSCKNGSFCSLFFPVIPSVTVFPQNSTVIQPETANLTCIASGFPAPNLQWFKQDGMNLSLLSNSTKYLISHTTAGNLTESYLMIIEADPFDAGMYICEASNVVGLHSQSSLLQVNGEKMSQIPCIL